MGRRSRRRFRHRTVRRALGAARCSWRLRKSALTQPGTLHESRAAAPLETEGELSAHGMAAGPGTLQHASEPFRHVRRRDLEPRPLRNPRCAPAPSSFQEQKEACRHRFLAACSQDAFSRRHGVGNGLAADAPFAPPSRCAPHFQQVQRRARQGRGSGGLIPTAMRGRLHGQLRRRCP